MALSLLLLFVRNDQPSLLAVQDSDSLLFKLLRCLNSTEHDAAPSERSAHGTAAEGLGSEDGAGCLLYNAALLLSLIRYLL